MSDQHSVLDLRKATSFIEQTWEESIIPDLFHYIAIPNKSPAFDPDWQKHGFMDQAVELMTRWAKAQHIQGFSCEVVLLENRTPLIYIEVPGQSDVTVLMYGHLDKQPEMSGWDDDLAPWKPVRKGDKLYGRGAADDGYAIYASLTAIKCLQQQGKSHARCVVMIEACEESGSPDLPFYVDHLSDRIGQPELVICLDSSTGNYEQLWSTTSLRGLVNGTLSVEVLKRGLHSGSASGVVPDAFRIFRQLLERIEKVETGEITLPALLADIPMQRIEQAALSASILKEGFTAAFSLKEGVQALFASQQELMLNRTWRASLTVIGLDGLPAVKDAGNVLRPRVSAKLSLRLPPTCDAEKAMLALKKILEADPPYHAKVSFESSDYASGWHAPLLADWLRDMTEAASQCFYGKPAVYFGEGASIPFMGMLGEKFPQAQFLITGVLGPNANAHGPNECLHLDYAKKLTGCVAYILAQHFKERCHD